MVLLVARLVGITGALLQEGVGDLVVNVLMEHVLVRGLYVPIVIYRFYLLRDCEAKIYIRSSNHYLHM